MIKRRLLTLLGLGFVGLGVAGYFLPVMPGTIFMILALGCFAKADSRFEPWLLNHPRFGPTLRNWRETRSIRRKTKALAIATLWASILTSCWFAPRLDVRVALIAVAVAVSAYIATRPHSPEEAASAKNQ